MFRLQREEPPSRCKIYAKNRQIPTESSKERENMKKKIMCVAVSCAMCLVSYPCSVAESAVLEPKLVHTERWTTSYYIDDDKDTLYPYIQCVANIYSNGYIFGWMWNTHEWDGYETIYNDVTMVQSLPYSVDSMEYCLATNGSYTDDYAIYTAKDKPNIVMNYYPDGYQFRGTFEIGNDYFYSKSIGIPYTEEAYHDVFDGSTEIRIPYWHGALCKLSFFDENRSVESKYSEIYGYSFRFSTNSEDVLSKANNFRLFGHEFTITPEMLNNETPTQNDVSGGSNEELEKYKALYEEAISASKEKDETIEALKSEIERLKANQPICGDTDDDGRVSISDSVVLNRYLAGTIESLPCKNPPPDDEPEEE